MKWSSPRDEESILRILRQDLQAALQRRESASAQFDEATAPAPSGLPYPDNVHQIQMASREYCKARTAVLNATTRLNEFLIHGTVPRELEREWY